jgi:hydrogenase nickel incorporation protein HypB
MCGTCGCAENDSKTIVLQQKVLAKNDALAERNRSFLAERGAVMLNLMSSPGAGKTTLLERSAQALTNIPQVSVIEGDQETALDADRIKAAGYAVVQINTGAGCHLDAEMVAAALAELDPDPGGVVLVENVGNLVCPALFDLGESARIVLASVTEGGDKPLKYPHMFRRADLVLVTKTDLLPYVDFDLEQYVADVRRLSPRAELLTVSARTGEGMPGWCDWLTGAAAGPADLADRGRPLSRPGPG